MCFSLVSPFPLSLSGMFFPPNVSLSLSGVFFSVCLCYFFLLSLWYISFMCFSLVSLPQMCLSQLFFLMCLFLIPVLIFGKRSSILSLSLIDPFTGPSISCCCVSRMFFSGEFFCYLCCLFLMCLHGNSCTKLISGNFSCSREN